MTKINLRIVKRYVSAFDKVKHVIQYHKVLPPPKPGITNIYTEVGWKDISDHSNYFDTFDEALTGLNKYKEYLSKSSREKEVLFEEEFEYN